MTAATDQFSDIAARTQEAVTSAIRTWADTVQSVAGTFAGSQPSLPDPKAVVDTYFDFAQQVLDNQRSIATSVLTAGTQAAETVFEQARTVTEQATQQATEVVAPVVAKAAAAAARGAKNAQHN